LGAAGVFLSAAACRKPDSLPPEGAAPVANVVAASSGGAAVAPVSASAPARPAPKLVPVTPDKAVPAALQSPTSVEGCALDRIGDAAAEPVNRVPLDHPVALTGWSADIASGSVPPVVILEFEGATRFFAPAARITKRTDVAQFFKRPELADSGYDALIAFAGLPPGTYAVKIDSVTAAGAVTSCDPRRKIEIK
jgi:hypothetical protein